MENRSAIMKISLGKISLVLWLITIAAIGFFMVRGTTADKAADARTPIFLSLQEKELVLEEMRTMLQSTQRIIEGTANNDMKQVAAAGRAAPAPAGLRAAAPHPGGQHRPVPLRHLRRHSQQPWFPL